VSIIEPVVYKYYRETCAVSGIGKIVRWKDGGADI